MITVYALWEFGEGGKYLFDVFETQEAAMNGLPFDHVKSWNLKWRPVKHTGGMKRPGSISTGHYGYYVIPMEVKS